MAEEANVAPAEAPKAPESVETPNINVEQVSTTTPYFDKMSEDDRKSIDTFLANNGGIEAFNKWKQSVSNPQPKAEEPAAPSNSNNAQVQQQPVQQEAPKMPNGYASAQELFIESYFKGLAADDKYKAIADEISSGEVLKKMQQEFGINAVNEYGQVNVAQVKNYLDMYAATKPTASTGVEPTNIPTVDYLDITSVNSRDDALAIMAQTREAQAKGLAAHPKFEEAKKFLQDSIFGAK